LAEKIAKSKKASKQSADKDLLSSEEDDDDDDSEEQSSD